MVIKKFSKDTQNARLIHYSFTKKNLLLKISVIIQKIKIIASKTDFIRNEKNPKKKPKNLERKIST